MEKLSMCRICFADDLRTQVLMKTHLQEIFQCLSLMPFATPDKRPTHACFMCCAELQKCYELRKSILRSEQLFTEMLCTDRMAPLELREVFHKNRLRVTQVVDISIGIDEQKDEHKQKVEVEIPNPGIIDANAIKVEVKVEVPEVCEYDPIETDEDNLYLDIVKEENDNITSHSRENILPDSYHLPPDTQLSYIHMEEEISLELRQVLKREPKESLPDTSAAKPQVIVTPKPRQDLQRISHVAASDVKKTKQRTTEAGEAKQKSVQTSKVEKCVTKTEHESVHEVSDNKDGQKEEKRKKCSNHTVNAKQMLTHIDNKQFKCNVCPKKFRLQSHLNNHNRTHTGEKSFQCTYCEKRFFKRSHLDIHIRIHTGEKPYPCNLCGKCFTVRSHLNIHVRRNHSTERPFKCKVCGKGFKDNSGLSAHFVIHTGEKPYQCKICDKSFNAHGNLNKHVRTHTNEKRYQCDICQKCFSQKVQLGYHIHRHIGIKPYECSVCDKCFVTNSHLVTHMRTHTGEKPYQCNMCDKRYRRRAELTKHHLKHTGEIQNI